MVNASRWRIAKRRDMGAMLTRTTLITVPIPTAMLRIWLQRARLPRSFAWGRPSCFWIDPQPAVALRSRLRSWPAWERFCLAPVPAFSLWLSSRCCISARKPSVPMPLPPALIRVLRWLSARIWQRRGTRLQAIHMSRQSVACPGPRSCGLRIRTWRLLWPTPASPPEFLPIFPVRLRLRASEKQGDAACRRGGHLRQHTFCKKTKRQSKRRSCGIPRQTGIEGPAKRPLSQKSKKESPRLHQFPRLQCPGSSV